MSAILVVVNRATRCRRFYTSFLITMNADDLASCIETFAKPWLPPRYAVCRLPAPSPSIVESVYIRMSHCRATFLNPFSILERG